MGIRKLAPIIAAIIGFGGVACTVPPPPVGPVPNVADTTAAPEYKNAMLTRDGSDVFTFTAKEDGTLKVVGNAANTNPSNTRVLVWTKEIPKSMNQQACVTFTDNGGQAQEGIALRIRKGNGRTTAVTVTKNILYGLHNTINIHTWDTNRAGNPFKLFSFKRFNTLVEGSDFAPYPWTLCAKASDRTIRAKVWHSGQDEPSWDDKAATMAAQIPEDLTRQFTLPGYSGLFTGHLAPKGTVIFSGIEVSKVVP